MNKVQTQVKAFREIMKLPISQHPKILTEEEYALHIALLQEELDEIKEATADKDIVKIADGIGDLIYIAYGLALHSGLDMENIHEAIHKANLSKLDDNGEPIYNEVGKVIKSHNFVPPEREIEHEILQQNIASL